MQPALLDKAKALFATPIFDLIYEAHRVHREHHKPVDVQKCSLLSIKTGACPEDCSYCPQSVHYTTDVEREPLMAVDKVQEAARQAKSQGAERFCMAAAWRGVRNGAQFDRVLEMVRVVKDEGLEVCVSLGLLKDEEQAQRLKDAGVYAYNHNLDSSREFYPKVITTRTYDDRLNTIGLARKAGMTVCCGGIIGMGETQDDRCALLAELASMDPYPESVPINLLMPVKGTPQAENPPVDVMDLVRTVAAARILMPKARVRLSAGRTFLTREAHVLAFFAGANSIFLGDKLLTRDNPDFDDDKELLAAIS